MTSSEELLLIFLISFARMSVNITLAHWRTRNWLENYRPEKGRWL